MSLFVYTYFSPIEYLNVFGYEIVRSGVAVLEIRVHFAERNMCGVCTCFAHMLTAIVDA